MNEIVQRLQSTYRLSSGAHKSHKEGMCFMEFVSHISGSAWSDAPPCTSPGLSSLFRAANDNLPDNLRQDLMRFVPRVVGLIDDSKEEALAYLCADRACRVFAPIALAKAGMNAEAEKLKALAPVVDKRSANAAAHAAHAAKAANAAANAAHAAYAANAANAAAWQPLFDLLEDAVKLYEDGRHDPEEALLCKLKSPMPLPKACLTR